MDLQQILAAILNPNGSQQAQPQMAVQQVGDHNNPALLQQAMARAQQPTQMPQQQLPPQAPPQQAMAPNAPQQATQAAPPGGGLGGILQTIIAPQSSQKNATVGWLTKQGIDPGTATVLASDKGALRQYILARSKGATDKPIEINGQLVDPTTYKVVGDYRTAPDRKIEHDANGVPRYVDTGQPVYPGDQNTGKEMFPGKSPEAIGLNYLVSTGALTKDQAANVASGKTVTGPNGEIIFMTAQGIFQQPPGGGAPQPVGGQPNQQGGNIPITGPKYSEDMRKAGGFAMRAAEADKIVADPAITAAGTSYEQKLRASAPFGNYLVSSDYQKFDQAQRDFVNSVLRRESGAAISESEFQNARQQYFPQPGDGPDVIKQKAANRQLAIDSLRQSADPVPSLSGSPAPSAPPPQTGSDTPPASYTGKNWQYLTPEQRKLWQ